MKNLEDLTSILSLDIPREKPKSIGFLEIAGMSHYENVNSRIYAYFLDSSNHPELADLFLQSLLSILEEKTGKTIPFGEYLVNTEVKTEKGNRIDITLNCHYTKSAVIIENKIYHYLNNDLEDYWKHYGYIPENQLGVLLTLETHDIPDESKGKFINVTHIEWIQKIKAKGLPYNLPERVYTYLNDFFKTIEHLTKTTEMNEQTKFYFQHAQKMMLAKSTYDEANAFLVDQMNVLASKLGWVTYGSQLGWRNIWDAKNNCDSFYTIWYQPLIDGNFKIIIIIELIRKDKERVNELTPILENHPKMSLFSRGVEKRDYLQFLTREYSLTIDEVSNLAESIEQKIKDDFEDIMMKILHYFYPQFYNIE